MATVSVTPEDESSDSLADEDVEVADEDADESADALADEDGASDSATGDEAELDIT